MTYIPKFTQPMKRVITPAETFDSARIKTIKAMLAMSNMTRKEIAEAIGIPKQRLDKLIIQYNIHP